VNIALQNSTVKSYLTGNWTINGVALDARVTRAGGGQPENSLNTPDVIFETDSDYIHAYVDVQNRTVAYIGILEKRTPLVAPP